MSLGVLFLIETRRKPMRGVGTNPAIGRSMKRSSRDGAGDSVESYSSQQECTPQHVKTPSVPSDAGRKTRMNGLEAIDFKTAIYHEAGHYVVAGHFGCPGNFMVWRAENPKPDDKLWVGNHRCYERSPFQNSCIGWAGVLAEPLAFDDASADDIDAEETLIYFDDMRLTLSESDKRLIEGHNQKWRACRVAERILRKRYEELQRIAHWCFAHVEDDQVYCRGD
jgi:hypothetical protein